MFVSGHSPSLPSLFGQSPGGHPSVPMFGYGYDRERHKEMSRTQSLPNTGTLLQYCYGRPFLQALLLPNLNTISIKCVGENSL